MVAEINDNVLFVAAIRRITEDRRVSRYVILLRLLKGVQDVLSRLLLIALVGIDVQDTGDILFDLGKRIVLLRLNTVATANRFRIVLDVGDIDQLHLFLCFLSSSSSISVLIGEIPLLLLIMKDTVLLHLVEAAITHIFLFVLLELLR